MRTVIEIDRVFPYNKDYRYQVTWIQSVISERRRYLHKIVNPDTSKVRYLDNNGDEVCYMNEYGMIQYQPFIVLAGSKNKVEYVVPTLAHCYSDDRRRIDVVLEYVERGVSLSLHIDYKKNGNFDTTDRFVAELSEYTNGQWVKQWVKR